MAKITKTVHVTKGRRICLTNTKMEKLNRNGDVKITQVKVIRRATPNVVLQAIKSNRKMK